MLCVLTGKHPLQDLRRAACADHAARESQGAPPRQHSEIVLVTVARISLDSQMRAANPLPLVKVTSRLALNAEALRASVHIYDQAIGRPCEIVSEAPLRAESELPLGRRQLQRPELEREQLFELTRWALSRL